MSGSVALVLAVVVLGLAVLTVSWLAVSFVLRSRRFARRPALPLADRPPVGLQELRSSEIAREVERGLATWIGYLRARALHSS